MSSAIATTTVAGKQVGRIGYGLMQLTWTPEPPSTEASFAAMKAAADAGSNCWSSASFYGNPAGDPYANIKLIAAFFDKYPQYKEKIVLVVKGGVDHKALFPRGTEVDFLREELTTMKQIMGDKEIDVFSLARLPNAPVEEVIANLVKLQNEGLFRAVGGSEMSAESMEKANKITPLAINEIEVSLWSYEPAIQAAIAYSSKASIPIFAYSPLGRGFLTRTYKTPEDIPEKSLLKHVPRFIGEAFYENLKLVDRLDELAEKKGVTTSQLALAWIISLSDQIIPIPGSSKPERVVSNIKSLEVTLTPEELKTLNDILATFEVQGTRYPARAVPDLMK
ncbi:hypothetical protein IAT38_005971 [Cryptococcus sp. DSM 104549]